MDKAITTLTLRSKIVVRWTTNPADFGYEGRPSAWREQAGETMSLRRANGFAYELGQRIGHGTYRAISYRHRGVEVSAAEISEAAASAEFDREFARQEG